MHGTVLDMAPKAKGGGGALITDPRFAAVHSDPRFQRFPKANRNVEIDERFAGNGSRVNSSSLFRFISEKAD